MLALVAGFTLAPNSVSANGFTDSLHYKLVGDTAVWDEELGAYTVEVYFEMKWDVPGERVQFISLGVSYDTTVFSFESATMDSANWHRGFVVLFPPPGGGTPWDVFLEWCCGLFDPDSTSNWTTGGLVRYGSLKFTVLDNSNPLEAEISVSRTTGNHTVIKIIDPAETWFLLDSNYTDGTVTFLGVTETPCCNSPGDANNSGTFNISDVTFVIARIFAGGVPAPCLAEADADANATLNIADVTFMIARIFAGGPAPSCVSTIP